MDEVHRLSRAPAAAAAAASSLQTPYTLRRVQEMLGLSRSVLSGLIAAGFVTPTRGPRNEHRFSFRDLMLLRTAHGLQRAGITPAKIVRALGSLKSQLPAEVPLTGLRISAVGSDVAVRDRHGQLQAESGQWLMEFDVEPVGGSVRIMPIGQSAPAPVAAAEWFRQGEAFEAKGDAGQAARCYRGALEIDPADLHSYLNLGALLCEAGRYGEASALYRTALAEAGAHALLHFNHAVTLEGEAEPEAALASYRLALALDSTLADAHYNAAVLLEAGGDARGALRHFNAYRRLQSGDGAN